MLELAHAHARQARATALPFGRQARPSVAPAGLPEPGLNASTEARFAPGQSLFFDGDRADCFLEIVSGTVRCCRLTPDGRRQIYRFAEAGEMLGLGGEEVHNYSAEAVTAVVVQRHRLVSLDAAMARDERLRARVLQALRDELAAIRTQMMLLGRMSADEKIAAFLLGLSARAADPRVPIRLPMSRGDIGDYLGLSMETVSRKINELKRRGAIDLPTPSEFRITDLDHLEKLVEAA